MTVLLLLGGGGGGGGGGTVTLSPVGGSYTLAQAAAPGTNSSASIVSASDTWAVDDWIIVAFVCQENSVDDWTLSTSITLGGGGAVAGGALTVVGPAGFAEGGGYDAHAVFGYARVTTGFTGTITVSRTPAGNADHWTAACFIKAVGVDQTTPLVDSTYKHVNEAGGGDGSATFGSFTSAPSGSAAIMAGSAGQSGASWTAPGTFTERIDQDTYGPAFIATDASPSSSPGTVVVSSVATYGYQATTIILNPAASGGTTYTANLAGSVTPAGALAKAASAAKAGSTTPSGALAKRPAKALAGSTSPSGALAKLVAKALAGSTTPSGALATSRVILVALAGSITPSGTLAKAVAKALAGSTTPSGALAKADAKALAGSTTPTGAAAKRANKAFAGSTTPSGALATTRVLLRAFAGSITPSGALAKVANKALAGTSTPSGALAKRPAKALAGSVSPSGALAKLARKAFAGAITALGNLATSVSGPVGIPIGGGLDTYVTAMGGLDTYVSQMGAADAYATQMGAADAYVQQVGAADAYTTTLGGI